MVLLSLLTVLCIALVEKRNILFWAQILIRLFIDWTLHLSTAPFFAFVVCSWVVFAPPDKRSTLDVGHDKGDP